MNRFRMLLFAGVAIAASAGCALSRQAAAPTPTAIPAGDQRLSLTVSGAAREYIVHVPPGAGGQPLPVVIMFHGGGGTAEGEMAQTHWAAKADAAGFLAVFPEGTRRDPSQPASFTGNPQTWNEGSGQFYSGRENSDDVGFTRAILADLEARYPVDRQRIYVAGFSNGSQMAYRVAAEMSDQVAAVAPVASNGLRVQVSKLQRPVSLLDIQGADDPINPLNGGQPKVQIPGDEADKPSVLTTIQTWSGLLGCPAQPSADTAQDGVHTTVYGPCQGGSEIRLIVIDGAGHVWPGGPSQMPGWVVGNNTDKLDATDTIWDFFSAHPMGN